MVPDTKLRKIPYVPDITAFQVLGFHVGLWESDDLIRYAKPTNSDWTPSLEVAVLMLMLTTKS